MPTTLTSRQFNQDTARAKREAAAGPVFVTDRGKTTHVLVTLEEFERLTGPKRTIIDMLAMTGMDGIEIDFDLERDRAVYQPIDLDFKA